MHPSLRILALILLAVAIQFLPVPSLLVVGALIIFTAFILEAALMGKMVRRSRWLLLTLILIYAFASPGEYITQWPFEFAPTYEGLTQGLLQTGRLVVMLSGLAILLGTTGRDSLMAGIFFLIVPLRRVGICPERFTARLWLTLHYVEESPPRDRSGIWKTLDMAGAGNGPVTVEQVRFNVPSFRLMDWTILLVAGVVVAFWWGL